MQPGPPQGPPYGQQPHGQPPYGQQPYGQPPPGPYYPPGPVRPTNTMAIIALVAALVFAPAGIVCGVIARRQIRETGESGDGLALAAIIIGWCFVGIFVILFLIWLVLIVFSLALFASIPDTFPTPSPTDFPSPFPTS